MWLSCPRCGRGIGGEALDPLSGRGTCSACGPVTPRVGWPLAKSEEGDTALVAATAKAAWRFCWQDAERPLSLVASHRAPRPSVVGAAILFTLLGLSAFVLPHLPFVVAEVALIAAVTVIVSVTLLLAPRQLVLDRRRVWWKAAPFLPARIIPLVEVRRFRIREQISDDDKVVGYELLLERRTLRTTTLSVHDEREVAVTARDRLNEALLILRPQPETGPYR